MILIIDNYDSFTFNLAQCLQVQGWTVQLSRNDALSSSEIRRLQPRALVISPGPGRPSAAGCSVQVIRDVGPFCPILGVCLGMQCLAAACGAGIGPALRLVHGKVSTVHHNGSMLFRNIPNPFPAARYHSLAVLPDGLPESLEVLAWTQDGQIMALGHRRWPCFGVQFHPESFLTPDGPQLLHNFLDGLAPYGQEADSALGCTSFRTTPTTA